MSLHVIIGEDDYLLGEAAKRIVGDGVGLEVIDSMNSGNAEQQLEDLRRVDESFSTPPFLDPRKVTWWKNVHFLPGGGKRATVVEVKEALEAFAKRVAAAKLPDNQSFIISGPRLLMTSIFAKTLQPVAEMAVFAPKKSWEAQKEAVVRAIDLAAEMKLKFAPGVAEKFVAIVGPDSRSLASELTKLRDYLGAGAGAVTAADVDAIASQGVSTEPELWSVTDAIGARDLEKTLAAMRKFETDTGFAVMMTTVIERFFRQLLAVAAGHTEGLNPYVVRKNSEFLRNWPVRDLRIARARFMLLREKVVSGTTSGDVLVVTELARVCRKAVRR